jgi:hypothetical protein
LKNHLHKCGIEVTTVALLSIINGLSLILHMASSLVVSHVRGTVFKIGALATRHVGKHKTAKISNYGHWLLIIFSAFVDSAILP